MANVILAPALEHQAYTVRFHVRLPARAEPDLIQARLQWSLERMIARLGKQGWTFVRLSDRPPRGPLPVVPIKGFPSRPAGGNRKTPLLDKKTDDALWRVSTLPTFGPKGAHLMTDEVDWESAAIVHRPALTTAYLAEKGDPPPLWLKVVACDASPMELMKKVNRGWQVLPDYGQFGSSAYYMDHPYEPLFQAGGARELSAQQVIDLGYHLRPPMVPTCERHVGDAKDHLAHNGRPGAGSAKAQGCWRGARPVYFPQLAGLSLPEAPGACEYCGRDDLPTERALLQHQSVMHDDRRQQQQLGQAIVSGLQDTGVVAGGLDVQTIAAVVATTLQTLGYGARPQPDPNPPPEDDDDAMPEPEPAPEPEPEPAAASGRRR